MSTTYASSGKNILSFTPTTIREYFKCSLLFKLKNIDEGNRQSYQSSPALSFGISMHAALEEVYKVSTASQEVEQILLKHWRSKEYTDTQESNNYFNRGLEALRWSNLTGHETLCKIR